MTTKLKKFMKIYLTTGELQTALDRSNMIIQELRMALEINPAEGEEIWMKIGPRKYKRLF